MTIRIISIGKTNIDYVNQGLQEFLGRLKHYAKISWEELPDPKKIDRNNRPLLMKKEAELILSALKPTDQLVLLDEKGKTYDSVQFSEWINHKLVYAGGDLVFVIGGAYGFDEEVKARSNFKISLSEMTFNHQMVRLILAEQLYRAFTIIRGEPYHHA